MMIKGEEASMFHNEAETELIRSFKSYNLILVKLSDALLKNSVGFCGQKRAGVEVSACLIRISTMRARIYT